MILFSVEAECVSHGGNGGFEEASLMKFSDDGNNTVTCMITRTLENGATPAFEMGKRYKITFSDEIISPAVLVELPEDA